MNLKLLFFKFLSLWWESFQVPMAASKTYLFKQTLSNASVSVMLCFPSKISSAKFLGFRQHIFSVIEGLASHFPHSHQSIEFSDSACEGLGSSPAVPSSDSESEQIGSKRNGCIPSSPKISSMLNSYSSSVPLSELMLLSFCRFLLLCTWYTMKSLV